MPQLHREGRECGEGSEEADAEERHADHPRSAGQPQSREKVPQRVRPNDVDAEGCPERTRNKRSNDSPSPGTEPSPDENGQLTARPHRTAFTGSHGSDRQQQPRHGKEHHRGQQSGAHVGEHTGNRLSEVHLSRTQQ